MQAQPAANGVQAQLGQSGRPVCPVVFFLTQPKENRKECAATGLSFGSSYRVLSAAAVFILFAASARAGIVSANLLALTLYRGRRYGAVGAGRNGFCDLLALRRFLRRLCARLAERSSSRILTVSSRMLAFISSNMSKPSMRYSTTGPSGRRSAARCPS